MTPRSSRACRRRGSARSRSACSCWSSSACCSPSSSARSCCCIATTTRRSPTRPTGCACTQRVAAQAPELRAALDAMQQRDGRRFFLQEHGAQPRRRRAAGTRQGGDREQRRAHHDEPEHEPARRRPLSRRSASTCSSSRRRRRCRRSCSRSRSQQPYLVVDNLTVRPLNAFRGFKPAPGQEPELNVQLDVGAWAYRANRPSRRAAPRGEIARDRRRPR